MMRPAKLVEQQVGLALGVYCGGRGHGAFAPRLPEGVRHLTTSRSSFLFVATGFAAPISVAAADFGFRPGGYAPFPNEIQAVYCRQTSWGEEKSPSRRGLGGAFAPQRHPA
jgi:hypothetical protein